jgi:hypothetical protein
MDERQLDTTLSNAVVHLVHIKVLNIRSEYPIEQLDNTQHIQRYVVLKLLNDAPHSGLLFRGPTTTLWG